MFAVYLVKRKAKTFSFLGKYTSKQNY